ncbi:MAG: hypothetical protein JXB14_03715 [Candidatus Altiarchaeota archaeon]|nr:hypothetical protein [Candidatus Altiarchaeota archaeon]
MPVRHIRKWVSKRRKLKEFDPRPYYDHLFKTSSGHTYWIDKQGRMHGRESVEGARVLYVAGLNPMGNHNRLIALGYDKKHLKRVIVPHMLESATKPRSGKRLLVVFGRGSKRAAFISSPLQ